MSEPVKKPTSLWLRIRYINEYGHPKENADLLGPTEKTKDQSKEETSKDGKKYKQTYSSFAGLDVVCEVMDGDRVVGILPTFQDIEIGIGIGRITTEAQLTFLCFDDPVLDKGQLGVR